MNNEELKERTKKFALRCIRLARALSDDHLEQHIRIQLMTLSTSCAINVRASSLTRKRNDINEKLHKALEEIDGCCFWIECIITEALKRETKVKPLLAEALGLRNSIFNSLNENSKGKNSIT